MEPTKNIFKKSVFRSDLKDKTEFAALISSARSSLDAPRISGQKSDIWH